MAVTENRQLPAATLFAGIPEEDRPEVLACCLRVDLGAGESVFLEGEPAEDFFVIVSGSVRVSVHAPQGEVTLAELGAGAVLGEVSLLLGGEHSASAHTLESTTLLRFQNARFQEWLESRSAAACRALLNMAKSLAARLRTADSHLKDLAGRPSRGNRAAMSDLNKLRKTFFSEWA